MATRIGDTLLAVVPKSDLRQVVDEFVVSRRAGNCSKGPLTELSEILKGELDICVCGEPEANENTWEHDCAVSTENTLLAVIGLELGAVWLDCIRGPSVSTPSARCWAFQITSFRLAFCVSAIRRRVPHHAPTMMRPASIARPGRIWRLPGRPGRRSLVRSYRKYSQP